MCVRIDGGSPGNVEARFGPVDNAGKFIDFGAGLNPKDCFKTGKGTLSPDVARRLTDLASKILTKKKKVRSTVIDGFPVSCALILGGTRRAKIISCNLAGIPDNQKGEPQILLVGEVFSAGRALIDSPSGFGSTNLRTGEIQIGGV